MFSDLSILPPDPILGLGQLYKQDPNPNKINLSVGVYQNPEGITPIFAAVKQAEQQMLAAQNTKTYIAQQGDDAFLAGMATLLLGDALVAELGDRAGGVMTPGGCGALRMSAEMLIDSGKSKTVWASDPTWANHFPLLQSAGLELKTYRYYDAETKGVDFQGMVDALSQIPEGDTVLLHACCHNPTGANLTKVQWDEVIGILAQRRLLPFIDIAYQGFGDSLDDDAYGIREAVKRLPEVLIAASCSKNFGLYRERTGAILVVSDTVETTKAALSHVMGAARKSYSIAPYHGGGIVGTILSDAGLTEMWKTELEQVRLRMKSLRQQLCDGLNTAQSQQNFDFVGKSGGMFCYLGISQAQILKLRADYGIYLLDSSRINIAGLSEVNLPVIIDAVAKTMES
jgi:aspartate aminotransferase